MTIELSAGDLRVAFEPETGGAVSGFTWRDIPLLRGVVDSRLGLQHGRPVAAYPLVPFANRVAYGRFSFAGQDYQLARNFGDHPHTIHGNGWMHVWQVAEHSERNMRMVLDFQPVGALAEQWPFAYRAEQIWELTGAALNLTLGFRNTGDRPAPAGLGLHPYVARTPRTMLRFDTASVWLPGDDSLPKAREPAHGSLDFTLERPIGEGTLDVCYAGWAGTATVSRPDDRLTLLMSAAAPMRHLQLYTPEGRDFIGLEPVSNMPDALNHMHDVADQGLVVLQPGETMQAHVTFAVG